MALVAADCVRLNSTPFETEEEAVGVEVELMTKADPVVKEAAL